MKIRSETADFRKMLDKYLQVIHNDYVSKENKAFYYRTAARYVEYLSAHFPCVLVQGARQVGKSTLLESVMPGGMNYVSLDDFVLAERARRDPMGFLEDYAPPLCIDEVQYAPDLLRAIKIRVDKEKSSGMYWMTGSQQLHVMKDVSETLAGRVGIMDLHSLSQQELLGYGETARVFDPSAPADCINEGSACSLETLYRRIWRGGYPALVADTELDPDVFFESYVRSYLERDVNDLAQVGNRAAFVRFMRSAAMRTGQQLVYADLARDAEMSSNTIKVWVSILERTGIISLLHPYATNSIKRLTKTPKLYFCDTGLCCWLAGWESPESLMKSPFAGAILENWVYAQLLRSYNHNGKRPQMYYYREANGRAEMDFLLVRNGGIYPMEVKRSSTPRLEDLRHASQIPVGPYKLMPGIVFCTSQTYYPLGNGNCAVPVSML